MADLVETVARAKAVWREALAAADDADWGHDDCECCDGEREIAASAVIAKALDAAIAAVLDNMAEPSDAAVEAAVDQCGDIRDIWQAMLAQYRKEMLG